LAAKDEGGKGSFCFGDWNEALKKFSAGLRPVPAISPMLTEMKLFSVLGESDRIDPWWISRVRPFSLQFSDNAHSIPMRTARVLVFVDESNVVSSVRALGRKLDWLKLRDHLANADRGRELMEMVIYAGLPPPMPEWQSERDKKSKFLHWLRSNGFLVVAKDGSPGDGKHYKANVDVLMAIDAVELSIEMRPEVVVLVTGDADFAHLALQLRRRGIRVEVAATAQTLGTGLKGAANEVIDLVPLFETFELIKTGDQ
jgi:uncharacterized LabA/DUF88 family protein